MYGFGINEYLLYSYALNKTAMVSKSKFIFQIVLGIFVLSLVVAACNNSSESKSTSDSSTTTPMTDTSKMMTDTTTKMDTGSTKPVAPGN
jgi:hypothetical protein